MACVFETFQKESINSFEVDPAHYLFTLGFSSDAMLRLTDVNLKLISGIEKYQFIEVVCKLGVLKQFWFKKSYKNNWQYSLRFLNCNKSSCIIFCTKMFWYYHCTYCLLEELIHFGQRVSTYFRLEVSTQFSGTENHKRKIGNILKDFWIIRTFHV